MSEIRPLHTPRWRRDGRDWQMAVGNRIVAVLIGEFDDGPDPYWVSALLDDGTGSVIEHTCWHAVDFDDLEDGKRTLEN